MSAAILFAAANAGTALLLAALATLAGRFVKRPGVVHAMWIVVLLELFVPPVFEVGILPAPSPQGTEVSAPRMAPKATSIPLPAVACEDASPASTLAGAATAVWLGGALIVLGLATVRVSRFRRRIGDATSPEIALSRRLERLSERMGVQVPRLRLVDARISPLIWPRLGGPELIFPARLLRRLDGAEIDAVVLHELAHVARRDHWVRLLELAAGALFWWNPVVWWARSRLRAAEERCCDQRVMRAMPRRCPAYARGLVKTVEFLAGTDRTLPALASGAGGVRDMKERLTMIMQRRPPKSLSKPRRLLLALGAAGLLLVFPTWADRDPRAADDEIETESAEESRRASERQFREQLLDLERQTVELERALEQVRAERRALEREMNRGREVGELERLEAIRAYEQVRALYDRQIELRRQAELDALREALEREQARDVAEDREIAEREFERASTQARLERLRIEVEALRAAGEHHSAEELEAEIRALEARRESLRRMIESQHEPVY